MDRESSLSAEVQEAYAPSGVPAESSTYEAAPDRPSLASKIIENLRVSIRVRLSITITLILGLTIFILSFTLLARQKNQLYSQTVEKGKISLNYFAANANIPLLNEDTVRLNRLIKDATSVGGILYAVIVDRQNRIKAHIDPHKIGETLAISPNQNDVKKDGNITYFNYTLPSGTRVLNLSRPITIKDKGLGAVHVGLSLDFIDQLIYRESLSILLLSLFFFLVGIGGAVLLGISFSRPISGLAGAAQEIGKGNLHYRIDMKRKDELGDLASAFNYMADELDKKETANARLFSERLQAEKEARNLGEQLRQSQKMEAVGQLAGGIAHDFNNSLTLIKVCSQLALEEIKEEDPVREKIRQIDEATTRSGDLARQLLTFSRRHIEEMKVLDLNQLLLNLNKMLRRAIGENIELVHQLAENAWRIKGDPGQIEQVIVNLVVNARDAMPQGGKLILATGNEDLDEAYARTHVRVTPGRYLMLCVTDTGKGMPPEIQERIFEPFFTTKEEGKGTGLGLFMVYGIVQKHGGHIVVDSEPGLGTTFKIYLPRADRQMKADEAKPAGNRLPGGRETILIVEDEKDVRTSMAQALKQQGYRILEAANGQEGLLMFDKHRQELNLIVTDIVMPLMNGFELADLLMPVSPHIRVLYMSGYLDNPDLQKRSLNPETNFIQKPFSLADLATRVRKILDA